MAGTPERVVMTLRVDADGRVWDGPTPADLSVEAAVRHKVQPEAAKQVRPEDLRTAGLVAARDVGEGSSSVGTGGVRSGGGGVGASGGGGSVGCGSSRGGDTVGERCGSSELDPDDDDVPAVGDTSSIIGHHESGSVADSGGVMADTCSIAAHQGSDRVDGSSGSCAGGSGAPPASSGLSGTLSEVHCVLNPGLLVLPDWWRRNELCTVCFGRFPPGEMVTLAACVHGFCSSCYESYLTSEIFSGKHDRLTCLHGGCFIPATDRDVERLVSRRTYRKLVYFRSRDSARSRGEEDARWCAAEGCWARLHPAAVSIALAGAGGGGGGGIPLSLPSRRLSRVSTAPPTPAPTLAPTPTPPTPPPLAQPIRTLPTGPEPPPAADAGSGADAVSGAVAGVAAASSPLAVNQPSLSPSASAPLSRPGALPLSPGGTTTAAPGVLTGEHGDEIPGPQPGAVTCHECGARNCVLCESLSSAGHTCRRPAVPLTVRKQAVSFWRWAALHTRACPRCKVRIQKDSGCSHVTCSRCGAYFCYRCLGYLPTCCEQPGRQCVCVRTANAAVYSGLFVVGFVFSPLIFAAAVVGGVPYGAYRLSRRRRRRHAQRQAGGAYE